MKIIERIDQVDTGMGLGKEEDSSSFMTSDARIRCGSGGGGSPAQPSQPGAAAKADDTMGAREI